MADQELDIEIRKIEPGDKFSRFSIGENKFLPLKVFLQKKAFRYHEQSLAKTYAAFLKGGDRKILAHMTLVCGEIQIEDEGDCLIDGVDYNFKHYPALKIARLAVDASLRGRDIGRVFVDLSFAIAKETICPAAGCRFVVVDAKVDAVGFYLKSGFTMLDTAENRERESPVMFVDLYKLKKKSDL